MKLTKEHIGKKVHRIAGVQNAGLSGRLMDVNEGALRVDDVWYWCTGWELVPDAPAGLSLLEAMQSGKEFREVDSHPDNFHAWRKLDASGVLVRSRTMEAIEVTKDTLTARYELKPEPKKVEVTAEMLDKFFLLSQRQGYPVHYLVQTKLKEELGLL